MNLNWVANNMAKMKLYKTEEIEYQHSLMITLWSFDKSNAYHICFEFTTEKPSDKKIKNKAKRIVEKNSEKFELSFFDKDLQVMKKEWSNFYILIGEELLKANIEVRLYDHFRLRKHEKHNLYECVLYKVLVDNA